MADRLLRIAKCGECSHFEVSSQLFSSGACRKGTAQLPIKGRNAPPAWCRLPLAPERQAAAEIVATAPDLEIDYPDKGGAR